MRSHALTQPPARVAAFSRGGCARRGGHPPWNVLVGLGRFQWAQTVGAHLYHLMQAPAVGLLDPRHLRPPGAITLVLLPREQVPGDAARQLHQRRRSRCPFPTMTSVCEPCSIRESGTMVRCGRSR